MRREAGFVEADGHRLECLWLGPRPQETDAPTMVFLHEGLGCVSLWRDFPEQLVAATGLGALVYSRLGYGRSDPCALPRPVRYMHDEGLDGLPALLRAAGIGRHILVGHSDGASIALVYAGGTPATGLEALILEAPHVFAEEMGLASIASINADYAGSGLRDRLARHHGDNVDVAFRGWAGAWLHPDFRHWNLEAYLPAVRVPSLIVQGEADEYGTAAQCDAIARQTGAETSVLMLPDCGHAPHRDQPEATLQAMVRFIGAVNGRGAAAR